MNKQDRLENLRQRFEKLVTVKFHCRIITPMFLGDAEQKASLRPAPFKGLLRYWWRVAAGRNLKDPVELLTEETKIFGGGGEKAQKSLVTVELEGKPKIITDQRLPRVRNVFHPEAGRPVNPLLYLGYGPVTWDKGSKYTRFYLAPKETFTLKLTLPASFLEDEYFKTALLYLCAFGAIGSRSRNGWGSFQVEKIDPPITAKIKYSLWGKGLFQKDYPFTLAAQKEENLIKALVWKTKNLRKNWEEVMKELAEVYISVRTSLSPDGTKDIDERHLLGFPLTNHYAFDAPNWGKNARHASPLRLFVRKKKTGYQGFVLHLPFGISKEMRKNAARKEFFTPDKQFKIWQKVHQRLDQAMQRANINDCL
ncbi:CRISPR-associated RAMP protein, Cmr1 family [Thermodesulfatator indicus DSM 15286]|uniref:CRISPR-associated RAMP protein, Cmr1 family n=1 Tax=Thermodesulfatator indicus (strain DSM 15286 / JCM 11887 / CIR29812) TaxID=667014 RepID=F8A9I8_THEID|nr:type III-B CRISPR module RAMP protein Cmr1 [Thermodesulfatator indicus]AEH45214.1 CRISPR-associated RAMP protein, Cmr1 family [Thermodesulfatator indicus DSM 15286]